MAIRLTVCGPRGSFPAYGEAFCEFGCDTSCYCLRDGDRGLIMDCGSGLTKALELLGDCAVIDVLLSHVHYDHIMGLFENAEFFRDRNVKFYGNFPTWRKAEAGNQDGGSLFSVDTMIPGIVRSVDKNLVYELDSGFSVRFSTSNHGDGTSMMEIMKGGIRICFTGDYEHEPEYSITRWVAGCDLLLFDGSYTPSDYPKFKGWGHSSWEDGCRIALEAGVGKLVITHHAPQYDDRMLLQQEQLARQLFPAADFARQNSVYEL